MRPKLAETSLARFLSALTVACTILAPHAAVAQSLGAKIVSTQQPSSVAAKQGWQRSSESPPSGKTWLVVEVEFTPVAKEHSLSLKKMRLLMPDGKGIRPVALAPPWEHIYSFFKYLSAQPGVGQAFTLEDGDLFMFLKAGGGKIVLQAKNPVVIRFLFDIPAGGRPRELELDETTRIPLP